MKKYILLVAFVALNSCAVAHNNKVSAGVIFSDVQSVEYGNSVDNNVKANKKGEACVSNVLGLFATGNATVEAAKKNGNISKVANIDNSSFGVLGFYAKGCTIVYGE